MSESRSNKRYTPDISASRHSREDYEKSQVNALNSWFAEAANRDGYENAEDMVKAAEETREDERLRKTEEYVMSVTELRFAYMIAQEINKLSATNVDDIIKEIEENNKDGNKSDVDIQREVEDKIQSISMQIDHKRDNLIDRLHKYRDSLDLIDDPIRRQRAIESYDAAKAFIIDATEDYLDSPASEPDSQPASQEPDPTGNQGQGKQPAGGSGTKEPVTARGVAEKLRAEGKGFSLDAYEQALDDEGGNLSPREETLLKELDKAQQENQALQDTIKTLQEELNDIKSRLDQQSDNSLKTKFANIFERTKRSKELLKSKWVKIGAGVLATVSLLSLGGGLFAWNNSVESDPMQSSAAAESGGSEEDTPIFEQSGTNKQNNISEKTNESGTNKQNNVTEKTNKPTEIQGYSPEDVKAFRDNYGIGDGVLPFTSEADAMMRDGQGAFSLENEYAVGEALCSIEVNEGMNARGCYNQLGLAAAHNAQVMAQLIGQERGLDMTAEGYTQEVNAILDQLLNDPEFWSSEYSKYFGQERQVELRIDTYSSRTSHYNIDGRLEVSYGVPPEGAFLIVNNPDGSQTMIRVNCGGQVTVQERVYEIGENGKVTEVPHTPVPWGSTPQKPIPGQPGEQGTPPAQPGTPEEQTPQEPASKDSSTSIDENSEVPEGNKADAVEADLATGGDTEPSEQPGATYVPPAQAEGAGQVASDAQAPQSEQRQAQADQGVDTGDGNQSNSGTVSTN